MCFNNNEEIALSIQEWTVLFPRGLPTCFTVTSSWINAEAWLPLIEKGYVRTFQRWATSNNAELAKRVASCPIRGDFPLLNASRRNHET